MLAAELVKGTKDGWWVTSVVLAGAIAVWSVAAMLVTTVKCVQAERPEGLKCHEEVSWRQTRTVRG